MNHPEISGLLAEQAGNNGAAPKVPLAKADSLMLAILAGLTDRALRWTTMLMAFALFGYIVVDGASWVRLATASAFTVLVHLPLWLSKERA